MATTSKAPKGAVKTVKAQTKKAGVMTTASNVKTENAPTPEPEQVKAEPLSPAETAKRIEQAAKQSDQYEFDDPDEAKAIFDKLPEGEFVIQQGNKTVIQKL